MQVVGIECLPVVCGTLVDADLAEGGIIVPSESIERLEMVS